MITIISLNFNNTCKYVYTIVSMLITYQVPINSKIWITQALKLEILNSISGLSTYLQYNSGMVKLSLSCLSLWNVYRLVFPLQGFYETMHMKVQTVCENMLNSAWHIVLVQPMPFFICAVINSTLSELSHGKMHHYGNMCTSKLKKELVLLHPHLHAGLPSFICFSVYPYYSLTHF